MYSCLVVSSLAAHSVSPFTHLGSHPTQRTMNRFVYMMSFIRRRGLGVILSQVDSWQCEPRTFQLLCWTHKLKVYPTIHRRWNDKCIDLQRFKCSETDSTVDPIFYRNELLTMFYAALFPIRFKSEILFETVKTHLIVLEDTDRLEARSLCQSWGKCHCPIKG